MAFLGLVALWMSSHLWPGTLGECHEVPLNIGPKATVRDCQPYSSSDFLVVLAIVVAAVLLLGSADIEFTFPGFGTFKRTREGRAAAEVLKQEAPSLRDRGERFLETLPPVEDGPTGSRENRPQ